MAWRFRVAVCVVGLVAVTAFPDRPRAASAWPSYAYHSPGFTVLVKDSYDVQGGGDPSQFYSWMERAYSGTGITLWGPKGRSVEHALASARTAMRSGSPRERSTRVLELCGRLHAMAKRAIPSFSFDRGFEFTNAVDLGERQCLLQSVLIASMLQSAGVDAGVIMVFRSKNGIESNNGHVVTLVRLPDGGQVQVDASESEPFTKQPGVLVEVAGRADRQYVFAAFSPDSPRVTSYALVKGGRASSRRLRAAMVRPMSLAYVRSQFYFYRGERVPEGMMAAQRTAYGLALSEPYLQKSIGVCPSNTLALYSLGKLHVWQGRMDVAVNELSRAKDMYARCGWVPAGCTDFLALAMAGRTRR